MLATLLAALASGEIVQRVRSTRSAVLAYALAGVAFLCGLGFLVGAAYIATAARYGSLHAALSFGIAFIVIGLLVLLLHRLAVRRRERRLAVLRAEQAKTYAGAAALGLIPAMMKSRAGAVGVLAPLLGIAAYAAWREYQRRDGDEDPENRS